MKKRILSLSLAIALTLALVPAATLAVTPGTYNPGDVAVINAIIANNGLTWTKAPADGSSIPSDWIILSADDWYRGVVWSDDTTDKRILDFRVTGLGLTGTLDVRGLTSLAVLACGKNRLTSLDVRGLTALTVLACGENRLTSLDVRDNPALTKLSCFNNRLTALDVSQNAALVDLDCGINDLPALDVSKNTNLLTLDCGHNELPVLDVSQNTALMMLHCSGNVFSEVNISNNPNLIEFWMDPSVREQRDHNMAVYGSKRADKAALDYYRQSDGIEKEIFDLANAIVSGLTGDYEKVYAIYCWVACNFWYDYDRYESRESLTVNPPVYGSYPNRGVCENYARLTFVLLRAAGIPAKFVTGASENEGHAWNEAYADGRWIILDTTWGSNNAYIYGEYSPQRPCYDFNFDLPIKNVYHRTYFDYSEDHLPPPPPNPLNSASSWARDGITAAIEKGFVPENIQGNYTNVITRAEFCRMAVKWVEVATGKSIDAVLAENGKTLDPNAFTDVTNSDILAAAALGITSGVGNNRFDPGGQFTRQQAATMIMNTCKVIGADTENPPPSGFSDMHLADGWAHGGIDFVRANGIMNGSDGRFNPKGIYSRQEAIVTFNNINP